MFESKTWLDKAKRRKLISEEDHKILYSELNVLGYKLNNFIKAQTLLINQKPTKESEK